MESGACPSCVDQPIMRCGRCMATRCARHPFPPGERCDRCEHDWRDEAPTRRAAKMIFAAPIGILAGGLVFGLLLPITIGGAIGSTVMAAIAAATAFGASAGACRLVDRSARANFLRERAGALPAAQLLPPRRRLLSGRRTP